MVDVAKLKLRVQTGVSNPDELLGREELFDFAIEETEGIVENKVLANAYQMDIAYYRFLLLADAAPTQNDELNYKEALKALKSASFVATSEETGERVNLSSVAVKIRENDYL